MTNVQQSVVIHQPIEKVFAYVTDSRNAIKWQPGVLESRANPEGRAQVGTRVTDVRPFLGRKIESTYEISELEPDKRIVMKSISGPFPYKGIISFDLQGNSTRVTFTAELEPKGFFKLAEGALVSNMSKELESNLALLKQLLEHEA